MTIIDCGYLGLDMIGRVGTRTQRFELKGKMLLVNAPPLLKNQEMMKRVSAIKLWRNLLSTGWRRISPQWD